jgi:hypothetical protein
MAQDGNPCSRRPADFIKESTSLSQDSGDHSRQEQRGKGQSDSACDIHQGLHPGRRDCPVPEMAGVGASTPGACACQHPCRPAVTVAGWQVEASGENLKALLEEDAL